MRLMKLAMTSAALIGLTAVAHANLITNPDFAASNPSPGYGPVAGWTQDTFPSGLSGYPYLTGSDTFGGAFWNNGTAGSATTAGFVQVYGGISTDSLSQTITLAAGGTYDFSYLENARSGNAPLVTVLLNGTALIPQHSDAPVGGSNPFQLYSTSFVATGGAEKLTFLVQQSSPGQDETAVFTEANLVQTPEPSSLALLGTGMFGALGLVRRKMNKA